MKKILTALLSAAAVLGMSFTSLAAEDPAAVFDRVNARANALDSMDCHAGMHMVFLLDENVPDARLNMDMEMQMKMEGVTSGDMKYLANTAMGFLGETAWSTVFYEDGYMYTDTEGMKLKYPMDMDAMLRQAEAVALASDMESAYMKDLALTEVDGVRVLSYEADAAKMNAYLQEVLGGLVSSGLSLSDLGMDMSVREVRGAYILNDEDYYTYASVYMVFDMSVMDEKMTVIALMEMDINNPGQPVTVSLPSTEGYVDMETYYAEMFSELMEEDGTEGPASDL